MKISVIIPIYNVAQYLSKAIESLINQTHKDIEIICVNDGSTDNCKQIIESYASKDGRIKVINQENKGRYVARINGIMAAMGDYITFVDGDDWLDLETCEIIAKTAEDSHADIIQYGVVVEHTMLDTLTLRNVERWFNINVEYINNSDEMLKRCFVERNIPWNIATKAIKKQIAKEMVSHQEPLRINQLEDFLTCYYLFLFAKTWVRLDSQLYHYRFGIGISTKRTITSKEFEETLEYYNGIKSLQQFVEQINPSDVARNVAFETIPQYAIEDTMHFIMRMDDINDYINWSDLFAKAVGANEALHAVAAKMTLFHSSWIECEELLKRKKRKYKRLLFAMGGVIVSLLTALVYLLC